ncbi:MAG: cytochrome P450 [Nostoc sp.]|uniref:cytochrome P450 n=1 Tax=Nostoc sp. TaxID=1180 RepID=UPI002FF87853
MCIKYNHCKNSRFDPDRFAPPRKEDKKHPLALVGFGHGSHSCLGMEFAQSDSAEFEDYVFMVLRLLGIHNLYQYDKKIKLVERMVSL